MRARMSVERNFIAASFIRNDGRFMVWESWLKAEVGPGQIGFDFGPLYILNKT